MERNGERWREMKRGEAMMSLELMVGRWMGDKL